MNVMMFLLHVTLYVSFPALSPVLYVFTTYTEI